MEFRSSYFAFWDWRQFWQNELSFPIMALPAFMWNLLHVPHVPFNLYLQSQGWYPWWIVGKLNCLPFPGPGINDLLPVFAPRRFLQRWNETAWWVFEWHSSWMVGVCAVNGVPQGTKLIWLGEESRTDIFLHVTSLLVYRGTTRKSTPSLPKILFTCKLNLFLFAFFSHWMSLGIGG